MNENKQEKKVYKNVQVSGKYSTSILFLLLCIFELSIIGIFPDYKSKQLWKKQTISILNASQESFLKYLWVSNVKLSQIINESEMKKHLICCK